MASTVSCVVGWGFSDGLTVDATDTRHSSLSAFGVAHGATPLAARGGIIQAGGTPLKVSALGTPAMQVEVKAGRIVVPANSSSTPPFGLTLTANTNLDVTTAHATLPRIDVVYAKVVSDGTLSAYAEIGVLDGDPASVPVRPALTNSGSTHMVSLATISVGAAVSTITSPNVVRNYGAGDVGYTAAPGGMIVVPQLSDASALPEGTPFYSLADQLAGVKLSAAARFDGPMTRVFYGTPPTTDGNGDFTISFGYYVNGLFVATPFPNAIGAAVCNDATAGASDGTIYHFKYRGGSSSTAVFRAFDAAGDMQPGAGPFTVSIIAYGR